MKLRVGIAYLYSVMMMLCAQQSNALITEISSIQEINSYLNDESDTLIIFDIDNTLVAPQKEQLIGSDEWFFHKLAETQKKHTDFMQAVEETLPLYHAIQHKITLFPVEESTPALIQELQKNYKVIALTARGLALAERTVKQLLKFGINFASHENNLSLSPLIDLSVTSLPKSIYWHGIIFCNCAYKGKILSNYFSYFDYQPKKIIFIDDKLKCLLDVEKVALELGIEFIGLRYNACDHKLQSFDHKMACHQLNQFLQEL
jgi:hypothetical protein